MDYREAIKAMENIKEYWSYKPTEVEAATLAIEALEDQINNGWIPVRQRLPSIEESHKNDNRFIVTDGNRVYEDSFDYLADGYNDPKWIYSSCQPIAWQPLPEPYKG